MNDLSLLNELEQKIVGLVNALKSERDKNTDDNKNVIESQKLSKIEEHVNNMIKLLDEAGKSK
ncbi:MAG: hypothetical protein CMG41_01625 [Candidatus Marinimicrobia bacterium]|nr:hypothetical protein [Candidatus Neomarinimicrobiota bacterium]|tara:strand:- start:370 stop:558 length:189 start_codon:yes stop_codon:yes gene_type:complete